MEPWEALDIDDSDLASFLRPCKRNLSDSPPKTTHVAVNSAASQPPLFFQFNPHPSPETLTSSQSQSLLPQSKPAEPPHHLIPGPAGAVQAAMQRRALCDRNLLEDAADPVPTQEFIRRVVENGDESDYDFNSNAWLCALDFLRREGMVDGNSVAFGTPLSSIKKHVNIERVGQVVAVIKSYTPNGLGDLMVTLKDPSSTIGASVHRKVFTEGEFGKDIKVGSVLVLQKVAVFSPTRSVCYLNITLRNIVKIFSKDSGPPSELYPTPLRRTAPSIESNKKFRMPGNTLSLPRERTKGIITKLTLNSRFQEMEDINEQTREDKVSGTDHSDNGNKNQNVALDRENAWPRQGRYGSVAKNVEVTPGGELEIDREDQSNNHYKLDEGDDPARTQNKGSSTNLVDTSESDGLETGMKNKMERNSEILIPKSSIPHWTEEQLDELLAFD